MLAEIPMFSLLDDARARDAAALRLVREKRASVAGLTIYSVRDIGDCLYIVRRGRVQIFVEDDLGEKSCWASPCRGCLGEISMLDGGPANGNGSYG